MICECECGNPRTARQTACDRCTYLDGKRENHGLIIAALRGTDGLGIRDLCISIFGHAGQNNERRSMQRTMLTLEQQGRVRRYWRENDKHEIHDRGWGREGRIAYGSSGCWVYALDGMTVEEQKRRAA